MTPAHRSEAVVIGAGLAGLSAAIHLQDAGVDVQVIEARERVGGRVRSMRRLGGQMEAGGTFIGAGYRRVIAAAARFGIGLIDISPALKFFREQELVLDGEIIRPSEWPDHPSNPFPDRDKALLPWTYGRVLTARENPLKRPRDWLEPSNARHDISMHEWMRGLGLGDAAIKLGYGINVSYGEDARDVSALLMLFRAAFSEAQAASSRPETASSTAQAAFSAAQAASSDAGADTTSSSRQAAATATSSGRAKGFTVERGVQQLPEAMAAALDRPVHYRRIVTGIEDDGRRVTVRCDDGTVYRAAHVVCALPFGVLRGIAVDPPLLGRQREAVANVRAQSMTQLYFAHKSNFWEADGFAPSLFTDGAAGMMAAVRNGRDPAEVTGFSAWVMGRNAAQLDAMAPQEAGARVIREIEAVRPAARGQLEFIGRKSWGSDPCARGAWAYFRPGQITRFAAAMGAPHGRIRFCGEHLSLTNRGMEGAMESGERAARDIVRG